jgi:leucyl aminopeptidase
MYRFDRLKSKAPEARRSLKKVVLMVADKDEVTAAESAVDRGVAISEGIALAKDLGNLPGNVCTPTYLAEQAVELGKRHGIKVEVLEQKELEKLGMGCFLAVARGSRQPPKLIVMEYQGGERNAQPVGLVGKGITFDTGGISIKPAARWTR